jgi:hypothetical protein
MLNRQFEVAIAQSQGVTSPVIAKRKEAKEAQGFE